MAINQYISSVLLPAHIFILAIASRRTMYTKTKV